LVGPWSKFSGRCIGAGRIGRNPPRPDDDPDVKEDEVDGDEYPGELWLKGWRLAGRLWRPREN
jgi:hypothetical protein